MTGATELLKRLSDLGVCVTVDGDRLRLVAPRGRILGTMVEEIRQHKRLLLAAIRTPESQGTWARDASSVLSGVEDNALRMALRDQFEERAAICEYEGGSRREDAERIAYVGLVEAMRDHGHVAPCNQNEEDE